MGQGGGGSQGRSTHRCVRLLPSSPLLCQQWSTVHHLKYVNEIACCATLPARRYSHSMS